MPHAQPAAVQAGGMGGANNPYAVPARTGPGQEGWAVRNLLAFTINCELGG